MHRIIGHIPYLVVFILLAFTNVAGAQGLQYNLNAQKGLPSDHVYNVLIDRHGYLWIATNKGVAKYNGYSFKTFDLSSGLAHDDVWDLYEDKKGRIWLLCISAEMGYIYNDQYHKAVIENPVLPVYPRFYPRYVTEHDEGIMFLTTSRNASGSMFLSIEKNDTIRSTLLNIPANHMSLDPDGNLIRIYQKRIYTAPATKRPIKFQFRCQCKDTFNVLFSNLSNSFHIPLWMRPNGKSLDVLDVSDCSIIPFYMEKDEFITMHQTRHGNIYINTNKHAYLVDKKMNVLSKWPNDKFVKDSVEDIKIVTFMEDTLWGRCISTSNHGLYTEVPKGTLRPAREYMLNGYSYIGTSTDSSNFWWDNASRSLVRIHHSGSRKEIAINNIGNIRKLVPYDRNKSLLITESGLYWQYKDDRTEPFSRAFKHVSYIISGERMGVNHIWHTLESVADVFFASPSDCYVYAFSPGLLHLHFSGDSLTALHQSGERLVNLCYDKSRQMFATYSTKNISLYTLKPDKGKATKIQTFDLAALKKIDNLHFDSYGNIYVKTHNKLFVYHPVLNSYRELFSDYNLNGATTLVSGDKIAIAARAGFLKCDVLGPAKFGKPFFIPNSKELLYSKSYNLVAHGDSVLLNTDKGLYMAALPTRQQEVGGHSYKVLLHYKDTTISLARNDTILIDPNNTELKFDVVNPTGIGTLKYEYEIGGIVPSMQPLNSNTLYLPSLKADKYYTLSLVAYDDAWKSSPLALKLYVVPHWWQTKTGKAMLWVLGILGATLVLLAVVYATRQIVIRQQNKKSIELELRNLRLALELKSIYSQINPHFIFNTLTTGLYFIKKKKIDEAYHHISSFSDLLRAYIKSSRNKYTSISEEVENLENYMNLQLARFDDKFTYEINVDSRINPVKEHIPSLLLQPLVENAINHGIFHKEGKGKISIDFQRGTDEHTIVCLIDDDGIGRHNSLKIKDGQNVKETSYGTDLIKNLIDIFNTYESTRIDMEYIDKTAPLTGTTVKFTITKLQS